METNSKVLTKLLVFLQSFLLANLETSSGLRAELILVEVGCTRHCCCGDRSVELVVESEMARRDRVKIDRQVSESAR